MESEARELSVIDHSAGSAPVANHQLSDDSAYYASRSRAENTIKGYRKQWKAFEVWCSERNASALPALPQIVADYISHRAATLKPGSLQVAVSAIAKAHEIAGFSPPPTSHPVVKTVLEGIRREKGVAPKQVAPAVKDDIWEMVKSLPQDDLRAARDRALILIGFGAALRSSEMVALNVEDATESADRGLIITIRRSKTDQTGEGRIVAIASGRTTATDAATALRSWLDRAQITSGAIFRNVDRHGRILERLSTRAIALIVKERVKAAGLDPANYSSHSLRAGLATSAALSGATELQIARQTGHKSTAMVKRYVRIADVWRDNVTEKIGL